MKTLGIHVRSARNVLALLAALGLALPIPAAQAQAAPKKAAEEPGVVKKGGGAVERGAKAAASGVRRAGGAVARGAQAAGSAVNKGARKIGVPADPASAPKK